MDSPIQPISSSVPNRKLGFYKIHPSSQRVGLRVKQAVTEQCQAKIKLKGVSEKMYNFHIKENFKEPQLHVSCVFCSAWAQA